MIRERTAVGVDLNPTSKRTNITSAGALRPSRAWPTARNARSMFKILAGGVFDDEGGHSKRRMPHLYSMRELTSNPSSARLGSDGYARANCLAIGRLGASAV